MKLITDATNNAEGFSDVNKTGNDYVYDTFGNITQDKNKKITNVKYNHLNLPTEVVFNTGKINYIYDTAGTRLSKKVQPNGSALVTTDYVNGFQYENNVLQFFPHPEGYVELKNNQYLYTYQYKDHLGNVRLTYRDGYRNHPTLEYAKDGIIQVTEIIEENNYYPFGLKHKGYNELADYSVTNKYRYAYNGMEWQPELGLDLYDFGARNYDPSIGRWLNIDPLAEVSRRWTPYNYAYNNPIYFVDPDGMLSGSFNNGYYNIDIVQFAGSMESWAGGFWTEESSGVENDITVNSEGIVTNVVVNDKPHRVFDESGQQLSLNDSKDFKKLDNLKEGDRLYNNIDEFTFLSMILKAGITHPLLRSLPITALKSYYSADFGAKQIAPKFGITYEETEYFGGSDKSFYRFEGQKSIYNLADAGNFMWGAWMNANLYPLWVTRKSADLHSRAVGDGPDTIEDQRAIKNGYNMMSIYLDSLRAKYKKNQ